MEPCNDCVGDRVLNWFEFSTVIVPKESEWWHARAVLAYECVYSASRCCP